MRRLLQAHTSITQGGRRFGRSTGLERPLQERHPERPSGRCRLRARAGRARRWRRDELNRATPRPHSGRCVARRPEGACAENWKAATGTRSSLVSLPSDRCSMRTVWIRWPDSRGSEAPGATNSRPRPHAIDDTLIAGVSSSRVVRPPSASPPRLLELVAVPLAEARLGRRRRRASHPSRSRARAPGRHPLGNVIETPGHCGNAGCCDDTEPSRSSRLRTARGRPCARHRRGRGGRCRRQRDVELVRRRPLVGYRRARHANRIRDRVRVVRTD